MAKYFTPERLTELSAKINPEQKTGLRYYPLLEPGERFPINNPNLQPKLEPRALDDTRFLQAILEGITAIEVRGYHLLKELGAPELKSVRTVGGGAQNAAWTAIRQRELGVRFLPTASQDAAAGAARLAFSAVGDAGLL